MLRRITVAALDASINRHYTTNSTPIILALSSRQFHSKLITFLFDQSFPPYSVCTYSRRFSGPSIWITVFILLSFSLCRSHSPRPGMPVSVNKSPTVTAAWQALYKHLNLPTHLHSLLDHAKWEKLLLFFDFDYEEVMVALSESVVKNRQKRPLAEKSRSRHIRCNKTLLSRKPCIPDKMLLWITIRKSWSLFQKLSWKIAWYAPWWRNHDDVISGLQ